METNKLSVWDVVSGSGPEAVAAYERIEREFLAANGYPEAEDRWDAATRDTIRKKMSKRGERLFCLKRYDGDNGVYRIFFSLRRGNRRVIATSKSLDLQGVPLDAPVPYDEEGEA